MTYKSLTEFLELTSKDRLLNRLELCQRELKKAKCNIAFWSKELAAVVAEIDNKEQGKFNFEKVLKEI